MTTKKKLTSKNQIKPAPSSVTKSIRKSKITGIKKAEQPKATKEITASRSLPEPSYMIYDEGKNKSQITGPAEKVSPLIWFDKIMKNIRWLIIIIILAMYLFTRDKSLEDIIHLLNKASPYILFYKTIIQHSSG